MNGMHNNLTLIFVTYKVQNGINKKNINSLITNGRGNFPPTHEPTIELLT